MEAASLTWEHELLQGQQDYVQRQLVAGVARETVVRDLVGMGADANRAKFFVDRTAKTAGKGTASVLADARSTHAYLSWALLAGIVGAVGGGLLVMGLGLQVTGDAVRAGVPSLATVGRIEAASLLPGVLVGVVLRRQLCWSVRWRPAVAAFSAFVAILVVRLLTRVEILHEAAAHGHGGRIGLLSSGALLQRFATSPTEVYSVWISGRVAPLVFWDVAFVGLAAFVAAVFSRHPAEI